MPQRHHRLTPTKGAASNVQAKIRPVTVTSCVRRRRGAFALSAIVTLLLVIIAAPLLVAAAPPGPANGGKGANGKSGSPQAPQNSYALQGDGFNNGSSFSEFITTDPSSTCEWCFYGSTTAAGPVALQGSFTNVSPGGNSIGVRGWAEGMGVMGFQEDTCCTASPFTPPTNQTAGVYGYSDNHYGVRGESDSSTAVSGSSAHFIGVAGFSSG